MEIREHIDFPKTHADWEALPIEFHSYLDQLDSRREQKEKSIPQDPLYPSYKYSFSLDEDIAIQTILIYWNNDKPLPDNDFILDEIDDHMAEADYDTYVSSLYSY
jgi:hypothetical protein